MNRNFIYSILFGVLFPLVSWPCPEMQPGNYICQGTQTLHLSIEKHFDDLSGGRSYTIEEYLDQTNSQNQNIKVEKFKRNFSIDKQEAFCVENALYIPWVISSDEMGKSHAGLLIYQEDPSTQTVERRFLKNDTFDHIPSETMNCSASLKHLHTPTLYTPPLSSAPESTFAPPSVQLDDSVIDSSDPKRDGKADNDKSYIYSRKKYARMKSLFKALKERLGLPHYSNNAILKAAISHVQKLLETQRCLTDYKEFLEKERQTDQDQTTITDFLSQLAQVKQPVSYGPFDFYQNRVQLESRPLPKEILDVHPELDRKVRKKLILRRLRQNSHDSFSILNQLLNSDGKRQYYDGKRQSKTLELTLSFIDQLEKENGKLEAETQLLSRKVRVIPPAYGEVE